MPGEELSILNQARKTLPGPEYLHDLIRWSCDSAPAIDFCTASGDIRHISYTLLEKLTSVLAQRIAQALRATGTRLEDVVIPVFISQSPELYISWIAILKAGAAFCPVAIDSPAERVNFILHDVNATLVLTTASQEDRLAEIAPDIPILSVSQSILQSASRHPPSKEGDDVKKTVPQSQPLAYIMYTSGSTGRPKGVKISHKAVCQALLAHDEHLPIFLRFLQFASPTFDVSVFETFFPLFRGATLVGRDRDSMLADLPGTIRAMYVDAAELTPTVASTLLKSREAAPGLRLLLTIGEMLSKPVIEEFGESATRPGILHAMYGPTEASIHCTIATRVAVSSSIHNIGKPLATVTAVIIEASVEGSASQHRILPQGQIGELAVAGQLASGYLNRPEQTTAAFVNLTGYGLFYRTGDRARIAKDCNIEMLGRITSGQIKLRGQRVELGEIESIACLVNGVVMAAASIINDALVLFCAVDGGQITVTNVRETCRRHLLSFMVPGDIILLDLNHLPRLPSGKMDRKKIENDYLESRRADRYHGQGPMDAITAQICKSVSEELGRPISPSTPLWAEGLHSLVAIKIASLLRYEKIEVSVRDLLELETIAEVAARVKVPDAEVGMQETSVCTLIEDTEVWQYVQDIVDTTLGSVDHIERVLPCNAIQVAMLTETISNAKLNFNSIELQVVPNIMLPEIRSAFQNLAQKNEILRSGFVAIDHASVPFVQVVWRELDLNQHLSILHPLTIEHAEGQKGTFVVQIHHALYDGWSWDLIMSDLNDLLATDTVPERPQFRYVNRELRRLQCSRQDRAVDYWRNILATVTPFRLPQLDVRVHSGSKHFVECRPLQTSSHALTSFASRLHVSPQTVVSTAVSLLLGSYAGSSNVVLGVVSSGRHLPVPEIEKVVGPCLSTLPLIIDLSMVRTVRDLLLHVHGLELDLLEHGTLSLRHILATTDSNAQERLFDTIFVWQEGVPAAERETKLIQVVETHDCLDYALVIEAEPVGNEVIVKLSYNTVDLSPQCARNFSAQLDSLVAVMVATEVASLRNIWDTCGSSMLAIVNPQPQIFDRSFKLTSTIQDLTENDPGRVAVSFTHDFDPGTGAVRTEVLTYAELWAQGHQLAHYLQSLDLGADDIVCVLLEKSMDLYILDFAIITAGGAFLNIDIRTPSERIRQIFREVKCRFIITGDGEISLIDPNTIGTHLLPLSRIKSEALQYRNKNFQLNGDIRGTSLAYAVMTSGTTGVPKAILVTRENLLSNIDILSKAYPRYKGQNALLQACSPAFDVYVFELFWAWHVGMCLSATTNDILFRDIEGFIRVTKISHLSLTPSVAALIHPDNVPSVKFLVTAGEPMNPKVFDDWAGRGLFQGYGPAETTNICNVKGPIQRDDLISNVGPPFTNTSVFICAKQDDDNPEPEIHVLPIGAVGEILIGGEQVARGYANNSLTARSFIDTQYGRLYRSGDMGRLLANGDLILLGREDDQVKLRGQRIELGDINIAVTRVPFVQDAVTLLIDKSKYNARLVSFWTACSGQEPSEPGPEIYEYLEASLPPYMIPDNLLPMGVMPLTRQGKIDKHGLVQHLKTLTVTDLQRLGRGAGRSDEEEEFTDQEKLIAHALSEVTDTPLTNIRPDTSFYALGIDSISSVRFSQKLRQANIGQVDVSLILKNYSVRRLQRALVNLGSVPKISLQTAELDEVFQLGWRREILKMAEAEGQLVEKIVPCNALQESILVSQTDNPRSTIYEARLEFELRCNIHKLRAAWSHLVERHQILRTGFAITPSRHYAYAQVVLKYFKLPLFTSEELGLTNSVNSKDSISPPWRLILDHACPGGATALTLIMSHALYDFEALALLLREAELMYESQELAAVVSPDAYSRYLLNMNLDEVDTFWQSRLSSYSPRYLGAVLQTENSQDRSQRTYTYTSKVSRKILQIAAEKSSVTSSNILQAAWARLLSCYLAKDDVVFGNVFSGRNLPIEGVERMIAPLFNTLPLRVRVADRQSMRALTARIQTAVLETLPFQPSQLRRIVRNQKLGGQPLFDTLVLVQSEYLDLDEDIWTLRRDEGNMEFPGVIIEILPDPRNASFIFKLHIQSEKINSSTANHVLRNYDALLDEVVRYPQAQSNNFASINADLLPLHATIITKSESRSPQLASEISTNDEENFTDLELSIRNLFAQFSGIDSAKIQKSTSIFELGLDSLHVVQIASELRALGHNITGAVVLEATTIDRLSRACKKAEREERSTGLSTFDLQAFDRKHREGVCEQLGLLNEDVLAVRPCTSTQSGILTEFINSNGKLYYNSVLLELRIDIDLTLLRNAWQTVMDRNEMLRTGFVALNTSEYTYGMITYTEGTKDLPWLIEGNSDHKALHTGEACLQSLHNPCWRLLPRRGTCSILLEVHLLHSLYDASSLDGIFSEVAAIYQSQGSKLSRTVPVAPALCAVLDQSEFSRQSSEVFWREMGARAQPSRFPDLNIHQAIEEDSITVNISSDSLLQEIEQGCRRLGFTLQSVCQIAWAWLLAAYTGDSKVMFGLVLSGRTLLETSHVLFPTINTVPFSIEVRDNMQSMLKEATEINVRLYQYQFTPLTTVQRWLGVEGKIYDTILVIQKSQAAQRDDRPWKVVADCAAAEYAVSMEVIPSSNDRMELRLTVRLDVVPRDHVKVLLGQYEALLREVVQVNPRVPLMSDSLQSIVTSKDDHIPTNIRLLHEFVEATRTKTPNRNALEFAYSIQDGQVDKQCWNYCQLNEESNKIAHLLIARGVRPGDFVAVSFDKCPEASFAILAVLKAGCAYVAIDPAAPVARKRFILEDASCSVLLTTRNLLFSSNDDGKTITLAADDQDLVQFQPTTTPVLEREVQPSDTCYCLYTSGTTGQPKGCLITHASAVQAMLAFQRIFAGHWDESSRWLQFASFHFDVSVLEQYWSWSVGICVTSAPRDVLFEDIPGAIDALQITHLDLTPSLARLLRPEQVPSLCRGVFIVGGEQVTQDIIDTWGDVGCLYNFYGPSEVTIGCTVHKRVKKGVKATNIGQPWDNVGAFVLNPGSEVPVLRGAVGELCLSGPLVGKGYLNRPKLTAEKFVTLKEYNVRVYRSGDLVRLLHDDSFEFLGRIDDQVKLRGQRLEIREIDHAIKKASESIVDVATMVVKHAEKPSEQLVAFFTIRGNITKGSKITALTSSDSEKTISKLRRSLQDVLPVYMVPTHLLPISHIPLSANNKADLKALKTYLVAMPVRSLQNMDWNGSSIVPMTETIRKVINILATFLGMSEDIVTPSSRLFELGLDSISAVGFASALRRKGFRSADAATVMRRPVVADLAHELDASKGDDYEQAVETAKIDIERFRKVHGERIYSLANVESFWPCTPLQEDMLSKTIYRGDMPYYLSAFHYTLDNLVSLNAVRNAWTEAGRRFPILRTTFVELPNKQYAQVVRQHCKTTVHHRNLVEGEDALTALDYSASGWSKRVNVLGNDPCWEIEILETSAGQLFMSLRIFHALYDANCLSLMLNEVANVIKKGIVRPGERNLEFHEALPYGPLCSRAGAEAFWTSRISPPVLLNLAPISNGSEEASTTYSVEYNLPEAFVSTKNVLSVTESAIFQAAYLLSLHNKYDIFPTFGMVVSGRSFPLTGVEEICGPLFNTIPIQILPKEKWSRADLIRACHDFSVSAKPFEHTSLRDIKQWTSLGTGKALCDTLFVFQKEGRDIDVKNGDLWEEIGQNSTPDYPFNIEVELRKDVFKLLMVVDPEFLSENDLRSLSSNFLSCLEQLVGAPDELLLRKEGYRPASRQLQTIEKAPQQGEADPIIMKQVKLQVAFLAQQEVAELSDDVNLFNLGLDSISLIKLSGTLKKSGLLISVNIIMRLSTPANIARYLTQRQERSVAAQDTGRDGRELLEATQIKLKSALCKQTISLDRIEKVLPVTPMQEGVLANFEKYYHFALLKLSADTDLDRLRWAWNSAIRLHPILRTSFVAIDDPDVKHVFAQLIASSSHVAWEIKTIESENHVQDIVEERNREMIEAGLNYSSFTIDFLAAADTANRYILIGMSHAIYDGWSIQLLHQDVADLYNGQQTQRPQIEPYLQFILSRPLRTARAFWTEQISNYFPTLFPALEITRVTELTLYSMTSESRIQTLKIQRFCMDHSITAQTLGLALWTTVLSAYLKRRDICFGVVLACRDTEDADQVMFPTFNTVPFRPRFNGGSSLDLLQQIQQLSLQIAEHQDFPLKEIKKVQSGASGNSVELFDTLFVLQRRTASDQTGLKLYEEVELSESTNLEYPVNVEMDLGEKLRWTVAADGTILDREGVKILIKRLESTLEAILRAPNAAVMELNEAECEPETSSPRFTLPTGRDHDRGSNQETDATLRTIVFDTFASVARCSIASLSGDTNIYSLGLDSISVIKVTGILRKRDVSLPVSKIVAAVTLDKIVSEARRTNKPELPGIPATSSVMSLPEGMQGYLATHSIAESAIEAILPTSAGQIFMLDYYRASHGTLFYSTFRYQISNSSISQDRIIRAWDAIVRVFPALRTRFIEMDGKIWQVVVRPDANERHPPAAHLTVLPEQGGMVIELRLSHALYDAVSLRIIIAAFDKACQGRSIQLVDNRNNRNLRGLEGFITATRGDTTRDARRVFWTEFLGNQTQRMAGAGANPGTFNAKRVEAFQENVLSSIDTRDLVARAAKEGVSLQALFIAAVARVYATYLHASANGGTSHPATDRVVLGVYLANRGLEIEDAGVDLDLENLANPTVNVLPLVVRVKGELMGCARDLQEDLARVQRAENCGVSLREVWDWMDGRVGVEWFVNFLPDERGGIGREEGEGEARDGDGDEVEDEDMYGNGDENGGMSGRVKLVAYPHERRGEDGIGQRQSQDLTSPFLTAPSSSPGEMPWCVPSVDVEARREGEGALTIGVFAPEDGIAGGADANAVERVLRAIMEVLAMEGREGLMREGVGMG